MSRQSTSLERTLARVQWGVVAIIAIATVAVGVTVGAVLSLRQDDATSLALAKALVQELEDHAADTAEGLETEIRSELVEQAAFGREVAIYAGTRRVGATDVGMLLRHDARPSGTCDTETVNDRRWRVCSAVASTGSNVFVAAPLDRLVTATEILASALLAAALGTSALFGLLSRRIVRRTLTPLDELERGVRGIRATGATDLSFSPRWEVTEVDSVAEAFDDLLTRVKTAVERERRFVADASHELRTPLTVIRGQLDLLADELEAKGAETMLLGAQRSCDLLVHTTESLLALAREEPSLTEAVDVSETILDVERTQAKVADADSAHRLSVDAQEPAIVRGDPHLLRLAANNLVDNALKYSAGRVTAHVATTDSTIELVVEDEGPGIPDAEVQRLLRPFARGAEPRRQGTGLGLALVDHVARVHGGILALSRSSKGGLRVVLRLPQWTAKPVS